MDRLHNIVKPSIRLLYTKLLMLQHLCERHHWSFRFCHKCLIEMKNGNQTFFLKINSLDQEFYLFREKKLLEMFYDFGDLQTYLQQVFEQKE